MTSAAEIQNYSNQSFIQERSGQLTKAYRKQEYDPFNVEYQKKPTDGELRDYTISYLAEYRLQVQKAPYELIFGKDKNNNGEIALRNKERGEDLQAHTVRAIEHRKTNGDPIHREISEYEGLKNLKNQLKLARTGNTILWASPPGPIDQGYGNYGFLYSGKITKYLNGEAHLNMSAIRIENPNLIQYNNALNEFTGNSKNFLTAEEFIEHPMIISQDLSDIEIDSVLNKHFSFTPDKDQQHKFDTIIKKMAPMINDFISIVQSDTTKEKKQKARHALENYALKLKNETSQDYTEIQSANSNVIFLKDWQPKSLRLYQVINDYGYTPPSVAGSCGSTGESSKSNSLISITGGGGEVAISIFGSDKYGSREFICPACSKINIRPESQLLENCAHCGSEKVAC
jgi:hypothetical protein